MYRENIGLKNFSSPYVLYHRIRCFTRVEELPKWKSLLYRSIQFYIAAVSQEVSKLLPAGMTMAGVTEHCTQSVSSATQRGSCANKHQNRELPLEIMPSYMEQVLLYDTPRNNFANWNSRAYAQFCFHYPTRDPQKGSSLVLIILRLILGHRTS